MKYRALRAADIGLIGGLLVFARAFWFAGGGATRHVAFMGLSLVLATLVVYVERVLPSPVPAVPGIKLGVANIVPLFLMYRAGGRASFGLNVLRCLLSGLLFTGAWGMLYALSGAIVSFGAMAAAKRAHIRCGRRERRRRSVP